MSRRNDRTRAAIGIGLVITQKNEARLLRRNLEYHRFLGVTHFYVFDDGSSDDSMRSIQGVPGLTCPDLEGLADVPPGLKDGVLQARRGPWMARQKMATRWATQLARNDGVEWLISLDADELVMIEDPTRGAIQDLFLDCPADVDAVFFRDTYEVVPRGCDTDVGFSNHILFKTPGYAKQHRRELFDPIRDRRFTVGGYLGHAAGKTALRVAAGLIPKSAHQVMSANEKPVKQWDAGKLLHYKFHDHHDFLSKSRRPYLRRFASGVEAQYYPARFWHDLVAHLEFDVEAVKAYHRRWIAYTDDEIDRLRQGTFEDSPLLIEIPEIPEIWKSIGGIDESSRPEEESPLPAPETACLPNRPERIRVDESADRREGPSISMIIPAYNAERYIGFTIESLLRQTHSDLEIIVVDDGSTDRTYDIACRYAAEDSRITVLTQGNAGVATARNRAIDVAKGEFLGFVDADDIWHPTAVAKMLSRFEGASSDLGVVYAWSTDIDEENRPIGGVHVSRASGHVYPLLLFHNFLGNASSTIIRGTSLREAGDYRPEFDLGCEDLDLYLRLAARFDYDVVPEFLVAYRRTPGAMSSHVERMERAHQQVLDTVRRERPMASSRLLRSSKVNFYAYLAHASVSGGGDRGTVHWIWKSLRTDPLLTLCRIDLLVIVPRRIIRGGFEATRFRRVPSRRSILDEDSSGGKVAGFRPPMSGRVLSEVKCGVTTLVYRLLRWGRHPPSPGDT